MWTPADTGPEPARPHGPTSHQVRKNRSRTRHVIAALAALLALAALTPAATSLDPFTQHLEDELQPPSRQHPCGQDKLGRDVLARLVVGAGISLGVGVGVVTASVSIGLLLGTIAGTLGGRVDRAVMGAVDVLLAFPG
jgi:peptide/nickel transport system permease protein